MPLFNRYVHLLPGLIIRVDEQMNPIRNKNGFCTLCEPGEKGLLVGLISDQPHQSFAGYANNKEASQKKVIQDLFKKDQNAFNTGN